MDEATVVYVDPTGEADEAVAALRRAGFAVDHHTTAGDARSALDATTDAVVTEHDLPDGDGLSLLGAVRRRHPDAVCVVFTETALDEMTTADAPTVPNYLDRGREAATDRLIGLLRESIRRRSHTAYPLPTDEESRLDAVERLALETMLDDPTAVECFDRLTELAAARFGVAYAFVGVLDAHTEQFLACHGFGGEPTPREETICTYTLREDDVFVVEDVPGDPRFHDGPYDDLGVEWYAGTRIELDGRAVGTFCLAHDDPVAFDAEDRRHLRLFAEEATDQLRYRSGFDD
ncbi:GAF domain-containing protein [Salinirubrum litoreum]|uniref:GAF domain-containing protein n=1 Tax=Salinirubrum litoreum TaxID=1126234 RepID=A0ABD5RDQ1_9EURY|nr:GAF domain-containing protein [Salinirubrum litoreum]